MRSTHGMKEDTLNVDQDLIAPLMSIPSSCYTDRSQKSTEPESEKNVTRDSSKLGLFSLVGLSIVFFQV